MISLGAFDEGEELCPGLGVVPEDAHHGAGDGASVDLLHAAHYLIMFNYT